MAHLALGKLAFAIGTMLVFACFTDLLQTTFSDEAMHGSRAKSKFWATWPNELQKTVSIAELWEKWQNLPVVRFQTPAIQRQRERRRFLPSGGGQRTG
jgi:hypothetical protein